VSSIICFTSDFGLDDTWVGICHAVILSACDSARIVDLSHGIRPYDVRKGAAVAAAGVYQLPGAIHLVVVDPGVGGPRRDLSIETVEGTRLVGPDNGILLPAAGRSGGIARAVALSTGRGIEPSPTFRARDVLAPAAAALACGARVTDLGDEVDASGLVAAPFGECRREESYVYGEVLEADRFGSVRVNVPAEQVDELGLRAERLEVGLGHNTLSVPFGQTFSDVGEGEPVVLMDSSGWLTLSINQGSALDRYGVEIGTHVRLRAL